MAGKMPTFKMKLGTEPRAGLYVELIEKQCRFEQCILKDKENAVFSRRSE